MLYTGNRTDLQNVNGQCVEKFVCDEHRILCWTVCGTSEME